MNEMGSAWCVCWGGGGGEGWGGGGRVTLRHRRINVDVILYKVINATCPLEGYTL